MLQSLAVFAPGSMPNGLRAVAADGTFEGYASLFNTEDLGHDIVLPGAFRDSLSRRGPAGVKLLYQHDAREPLGLWEKMREDARGLYVQGRLLPDVARAREAMALIRAGALDGLSIGFRAVKAQRAPRAGVRCLERIDLLEISIVTFPMQPQARIITVESGGSAALEARGVGGFLLPAMPRDGRFPRDPVLEANARTARLAGARVLAAQSPLTRCSMDGDAALAAKQSAANRARKYRPDQPRAPVGSRDVT